jgi:hypothetical protein
MDLVLVDSTTKSEAEPVGDRVMVNVSSDKEQWIGVRTAVVVSKKLEKKGSCRGNGGVRSGPAQCFR